MGNAKRCCVLDINIQVSSVPRKKSERLWARKKKSCNIMCEGCRTFLAHESVKEIKEGKGDLGNFYTFWYDFKKVVETVGIVVCFWCFKQL